MSIKIMSTFRYFVFLITTVIGLNTAIAQPSSLFLNPKTENDFGWKINEEVGLYFNQVSFTNWNAGGANSISAIFNGRAEANYKNDKLFWNSSLLLRYGINKQENEPLRKTDDAISIISNLGFQSTPDSNWFYSVRFSFNTQFANGFNNPDDRDPISTFMAPGYLFLGAGFEYGKAIEKFSLYVSPFTMKNTFVLDDDLANSGAFGVNPAIYDMDGNLINEGDKVRTELGILLTNYYQDQIMENVKVNSLLRLYSDYLNSFGNIDIEWEVNFDFKVNKYISATFGSHLRYDNDIKTEVVRNEITNQDVVVEGSKLQWKQLLGVGVVIDLDEFIDNGYSFN
ncbi:DUF3078 domain-containing protein [Winogradskyella alexanderae]|uniref:DUF3078 domain-containing protein n=1 Tax=Winogradskyella alexanderae TaxID=2877123 RepID=A0ABS7XY62_9FLAO|nr:DUF3078 domain-containing protein [Winogradskyella alexanderae]MCA0133736.1 DUF3078 domain-containing protein [Winogradskyella alexanderae]